MHDICLCISTGRTGTTAMAGMLRHTYRDDFEVFHEDLREYKSKPRHYLWRLDPADFDEIRRDPDVAAYLDRIAAHTERAPYVDPGPTATPLVPLIAATFPGRVRVLHMVREPVTSAASIVAVSMYSPRAEGKVGFEYPMPPDPIASRCAHPEFAGRWESMSPFEKALWRWAEYNLFAEAFHARFPEVPFLRVTTGEFARDEVGVARRVIDFYGLPPREIAPLRQEERNTVNLNLVQAYPVGEEWRRYAEYPHVLELAERLGVPVRPERLEQQMRKYARPSLPRLFLYRMRLRLRPEFWRAKLGRIRKKEERRDVGIAL